MPSFFFGSEDAVVKRAENGGDGQVQASGSDLCWFVHHHVVQFLQAVGMHTSQGNNNRFSRPFVSCTFFCKGRRGGTPQNIRTDDFTTSSSRSSLLFSFTLHWRLLVCCHRETPERQGRREAKATAEGKGRRSLS